MLIQSRSWSWNGNGCLTVVVNWFSRKVLTWRLLITVDVAFCIEAVEEVMARFSCAPPKTVEARIWALLQEKLTRIQAALRASMEEAEDICRPIGR